MFFIFSTFSTLELYSEQGFGTLKFSLKKGRTFLLLKVSCKQLTTLLFEENDNLQD